ncbi:hypothetical protein MPER_02033, partial [Moniliophthora perniciosa FA553]
MAHDEMQTILNPDIELLNRYKHQLCMYFAEMDDWVGEQREVVLRSFHADPGSVKIVHGRN